jgi:hypothetical protein
MTAVCIAFAIWLLLVAAVLIFPALARIVGVLGRGPYPVSPRRSAWGKLLSRDHVGHVERLACAGEDPGRPEHRAAARDHPPALQLEHGLVRADGRHSLGVAVDGVHRLAVEPAHPAAVDHERGVASTAS